MLVTLVFPATKFYHKMLTMFTFIILIRFASKHIKKTVGNTSMTCQLNSRTVIEVCNAGHSSLTAFLYSVFLKHISN